MASVKFMVDTAQADRRLSEIERAVPSGMARGLNNLGYGLMREGGDLMRRKFDRPTRWTINSFRVQKTATPDDLTALVGMSDYLSNKSAQSPGEIIGQQFRGGSRIWKRFEAALYRIGVLPAGMAAVPGGGVVLDAYGNLPRGLMNQLLSYFHAFGEQGYRANMTDKRKARLANINHDNGYKKIGGVVYFVSYGRGYTVHLKPGIYSKTGTHGVDVKPIIAFVRKPTYRTRIDLEAMSKEVIERDAARDVGRAIKFEMGKIK